jgi:polysaccharide pyruvyl transferase CsaB
MMNRGSIASSGAPIHIGIVGSYGGLNLGDEAILQAIVTQLRASLPVEITVFTHNPEDTLSRQGVERAVSLDTLADELRPEVERLDLLILGGGGILFDTYAQINLRPAVLAQEMGTPVMVYAVGAGPLDDPADQQAVRDCLNRADCITVRALDSRKLLEQIGVQRGIEVTADPALLLEPQPLPPDALLREGLEREGQPKRRLVGMSVREPGRAAPDVTESQYHQLLANAADFMIDRYDIDIVFVPMERRVLDIQQAHAVLSQMAFADRAMILKGHYTSGQILSLMDHFTFVVGMRLHFLIFAALRRIPFVALPYAGKVANFLQDLQIPMPPIKVVNAGRLIAHIDRAWDHRQEYQARIDQALPALQERARRTHQMLIELLSNGACSANPSRQEAKV